tara:strand:+ start:1264 stop:2916 length:1653 start_codon:yes stop_codon:yes gene_type:complete
MCGIFGLLNYENKELTIDDIEKMCKAGKHRGPESSNIIFNLNKKDIMVGFHRLAINGLNPESNQPFDINNIVLLCNGEIYNYKELLKDLQIEAKTSSDCEVIIYLYDKFGIENTVQMLDGVFSFILYDKNKDKLFVARDPYGVRPLFTYKLNNKTNIYGFASELKQLYPLKYIYEEGKISQFNPGSYSIYVNSNEGYYLEKEKCYNSYNFNTINIVNKDEWELYYNIIRNKFEEAVRKRVETTERPIACLLSGGLDSSLVTSLVKKYYNGPQLETYSIGLKGAEDLKYAREVSEFLNTKHTEIIVSEEDFFKAIPEVIEKIESYDTTTVRASVGNYLIGKYISKNSEAKVIFNGDGSDELCGGYLYMHCAPSALEFDLECKRLLNEICYFDVLRSDRSISTNGLEPRTPFLDRGWVEVYLSIPKEVRFHALHNLPEKYLLRKSFDNGGYLPNNILWRTKEAFSDGVSSLDRSWYTIIDEKVKVLQGSFAVNEVTEHNKPTTLEQHYYRDIFDTLYLGCDSIIPHFWMPRFVKANDASARTLKVYNESISV